LIINTAGGQHVMGMQMMPHFTVPAMQDAVKADLGTKPLRISAELQQAL
jgi:hypothetical protein